MLLKIALIKLHKILLKMLLKIALIKLHKILNFCNDDIICGERIFSKCNNPSKCNKIQISEFGWKFGWVLTMLQNYIKV